MFRIWIRECGWSVGCRGHPCPWRWRQEANPTALECHAEDFGLDATGRGEPQQAPKQEPEAPLTPSPSPPSESSCPVLGEEVSRETAGPHLQGADGKGSETGVRSGWDRGVQTTVSIGGGKTVAQEEAGCREFSEGPLDPDMRSPRPQTVQLADQGSCLAWPLTSSRHGVTVMSDARRLPLLMNPPCTPSLSSSELQEKAATLLGVDRTLFVPTNTMANLISGERCRCRVTLPSSPSLRVSLLGAGGGAGTTSVGS